MNLYIAYIYIYSNVNNFRGVIQGAHNKFPDFFCMGTFIDCTHMKL